MSVPRAAGVALICMPQHCWCFSECRDAAQILFFFKPFIESVGKLIPHWRFSKPLQEFEVNTSVLILPPPQALLPFCFSVVSVELFCCFDVSNIICNPDFRPEPEPGKVGNRTRTEHTLRDKQGPVLQHGNTVQR